MLSQVGLIVASDIRTRRYFDHVRCALRLPDAYSKRLSTKQGAYFVTAVDRDKRLRRARK